MAVETKSFSKDIAANAKDIEIGSLTCAEGEKIIIQEVSFNINSAGTIKGYVQSKQIDEVSYLIHPKVEYPCVKNMELLTGQTYKFTGSDDSGAVNAMKVLLVFDRSYTK